MERKQEIIAVIGPTASGKSAKAIALAKERNGEVISVDSRQVYRMLDLGTEKIPESEWQGVPHHLIDIKDSKETYSAGEFVEDATRLITEIHSRGKVPVLAGGTHFYFDALLYGLPRETPPDPEFRKSLEVFTDEELYSRIQELDSERANELDPHNRRRLIRALEVIKMHGKVPKRNTELRYTVEWHELLPEKEELKKKIVIRLQETLQKGLIDEVRKVRNYVGDERLNELGLEYRIIGDYLRGERSEESLLSSLTSALFDYARRQEAWLKKLRKR